MMNILTEIEDMIHERAARVNVQSKHGPEAAEDYETFLLIRALGKLMDEDKGDFD